MSAGDQPGWKPTSPPAEAATSPPPATDVGFQPGRRAGHLLALLVLLAVPLGLRLWPVAHGAPHSYVPDTHAVRNALNMAGNREFVPPAGRYSSYPYLLPYVLLPVYATEYAVGRALGEWSGAGQFGHRLKEKPHLAHLPARVVFALLSSLAAIAAFGAARAAGLGAAAWFAAWFAGTCLLHVHLSVQERPWAPMATFVLLAAWPAATHARTGALRPLLASAGIAALAASMHQAGLAALGITGIAWAAAPGAWRGAALVSRIRRGFGAVGLFVLVALPLGYPFYVVHGGAPDVAAGELNRAGDAQLAFGGQQMVMGFRLETLKTLSRTLVGYDPALVLLALLGLVPALRRRALWPATVFALLWAGWFMTNVNDHVRYLLPLALLLALPAGMAAEALWRRRPLRVLVAALVLLPLVQALRLGHVLRAEDTRAAALDLLQKLPPDARVAIDVYGPPAPKSMAALETTAALRELYGREAHRLQYYAAGVDPPGPRGVNAVGVEDLFLYDLRHGGTAIRPRAMELFGSTTEEVLSGVGATHLLLVDRDPGDGRRPPLIDPTPSVADDRDPEAGPVPKLTPLELRGTPLWTITPGEHARDAHLPTEMRFPLTDLWRVSRPGPYLELWSLR